VTWAAIRRYSRYRIRDQVSLLERGVVTETRKIGNVRLSVPPECGRLGRMAMLPNPYRGFRVPPEVIEHAIWLYHCFGLSLHEVEPTWRRVQLQPPALNNA
jgi:hypothetical protein